ncbi:MAG: hypothetical protein ABJN57_06275 [Hyphomicrobiales bacterium]
MKIILHIGQSKTGTSAIQKFLTNNRAALREHGVLYPNIKKNGLPIDITSHNAVADALLESKTFPNLTANEYFQQFFKQAKNFNSHTMILSAEHFFGGQPRIWDIATEDEYFEKYQKKISNLAEYLKGHEIEIILYLRPQIEWFASAVNQTIRVEGLIRGKNVYKDDFQFLELMKPLLNYQKIIHTWQEELQPVKFNIVPYVRDALFQKSSISDFLKQLGLENLPLPFREENITINASISREYIEYKKELNLVNRSKLEERLIIKCMEELSELSEYGDKYKLDDSVIKWIEDYSAPQNEMINKEFHLTEKLMNSRGAYAGENLPNITVEEIEIAKKKFDVKVKSIRYKVLKLKYSITRFLRIYIPFLHGALHQVKRLMLR